MNYTNIFHTVPLISTNMVRHPETGAKVEKIGTEYKAIKLPKWEQYISNRNTKETPLLAAIARKDFIGIDIDDTALFADIVELLPEEYLEKGYVAMSDVKGGHLLFRYTATHYNTLKPLVGYFKKHKIDVQVDNKLIYLATPANTTKRLLTDPLESIEDLKEIPTIVLNKLLSLLTSDLVAEIIDVKSKFSSNINSRTLNSTYHTELYGFLLEKEKDESVYVPALTPRKDYPNIKAMNDIPQGQGTDWMLQVRRKLQVDPSVRPEQMLDVMLYLNSLWDDPMDEERVKSDVVRDVNSEEFTYVENWKTQGLLLHSTAGSTLEVLYAPYESVPMLFDRTNQTVVSYRTMGELRDAILALTGSVISKEAILKRALAVKRIYDPSRPSFLQKQVVGEIIEFNTFYPNEGLSILHDPSLLSTYREPTLILGFFQHLIKSDTNRHKFLQYLAYKYTTFNYSPLYFVLQGVGGAGKGVLVHEILSYLSGTRIAHATLSMLMNDFNAFLQGVDWLEIEEAGEGYTKMQTNQLISVLKRITGNEMLAITGKGKDTKYVRHFLTPILSTNLHTRLITDNPDNDRRMVLLKAPNKLKDLLPMQYRGETISNTSEYLSYLRVELPMFAAWLHHLHKTDPLPVEEYNDNAAWKDEDYIQYTEVTTSIDTKLTIAIEKGNKAEVKDILIGLGINEKEIDRLYICSNNGIEFMAVIPTPSITTLGKLSLQEVLAQTNINMSALQITQSVRRRTTRTVAGRPTGTIWVVDFDMDCSEHTVLPHDASTDILTEVPEGI